MKQPKLYRKDYLDLLKKAPLHINMEELQDLVDKTKVVHTHRESRIKKLIDYAPYVYFKVENASLGIDLFEKALEEVETLEDCLQLLLGLIRPLSESKMGIGPLIFLIYRAYEKTRTIIEDCLAGNTMHIDQEAFYFYLARPLHQYGYEILAFQVFEISLIPLAGNFRGIMDYLEEGLIGNNPSEPLIWDKKKAEYPSLIQKVKGSLRNAYLNNEKDGIKPLDICESAVFMAKLGWTELAEQFFKVGIPAELDELKDMGELWEIGFDYILEGIEVIADKRLLNNKAWALEIFETLIFLDCSKGNEAFLLSKMSILGDEESIQKLLTAFRRKIPGLEKESQYLVGIAIGILDSQKKLSYLSQAIEASIDITELHKLLDHVQDLGKYPHVLEEILRKARGLNGYYFEVFKRFARHETSVAFLIQELETLTDIDQVNEAGESLLIRACHQGINEAIHILIKKGANKKIQTLEGFNALFASVSDLNWKHEYVDKDIIFELIDAGIDIHTVFNDRTAFTEAACDGYLDVLKVLLERGASFEVAGDKGKTALKAAIYQMRMEVIVFLLEIGADATTIEGQIHTSYHSHFQTGADFQYMVDVLNEAGAKIEQD